MDLRCYFTCLHVLELLLFIAVIIIYGICLSYMLVLFGTGILNLFKYEGSMSLISLILQHPVRLHGRRAPWWLSSASSSHLPWRRSLLPPQFDALSSPSSLARHGAASQPLAWPLLLPVVRTGSVRVVACSIYHAASRTPLFDPARSSGHLRLAGRDSAEIFFPWPAYCSTQAEVLYKIASLKFLRVAFVDSICNPVSSICAARRRS
jgi:hypothetical protein